MLGVNVATISSSIGVSITTAIDSILSRPVTEAENRILTRYVLNVIARQPVNLQAAHNEFLAVLRNDATIPQNIRSTAELRLNRILPLFNQLRDNRTVFDNAFEASGSKADFLDTPQAQQLNQQYRQFADVLRRIVPEDAFGELVIYASSRPIHTVP